MTLPRSSKIPLSADRGYVEGSVAIHQDAKLCVGLFDGSGSATLALNASRNDYLHVARGSVIANSVRLEEGDTLMMSATDRVAIGDGRQAEVLLFDLA